MKNILITFANEVLIFSYDTENNLDIPENLKSFSCTPKDIIDKKEELKKFINKIIKKYNIKNIVISEFSLTKIVFMLTNDLNNVVTLNFKEKRELPSDIYKLLLKSGNIQVLKCYSVTKEMLDALENKGIEVILRNTSRFALENDLNEACFSKTTVIFDCPLTKNDFKGFNNIVKNTNCLNTIDIKKYSDEAFASILNILITNNHKKRIKINIYENNEDIIPKISKLKKLQRKYKKYFKFKIIYSKKYKEKHRKKQIFIKFLIFMLICLIVSVIIFLFNNFLSIHSIHEEKVSTKTEEKKSEENAYSKTYLSNIADLKKINDETVGLLTVNNTDINHPVVKHSDNDFYLTHDFEKKSNIYGWIFMDYRNKTDILDNHTIIYSHDSDLGIFKTLSNVLDKKWYTNKDNQIITFNTNVDEGKWQIFSIYELEDNTLPTNFSTQEEYTKFLNMIKERSIYDFKVNLAPNDKILTLSTCYGDKQRLFVHAKKLA